MLCAAGEIRLAKYQEAISLLMRFGAACDRLGLRPCKAYLGAIVVCLYAQDAQQAMATLQVGLPLSAPGVCLSTRRRRQQQWLVCANMSLNAPITCAEMDMSCCPGRLGSLSLQWQRGGEGSRGADGCLQDWG